MTEKVITGTVVACISAVTGSFFLWAAFQHARWVWRLAAKAMGTVQGFHEDTFPGSHGTFYFPRVAFTAGDGSSVEFQSGSGSTRPRYAVGARVRVRYLPSKPGEACIDSFGALWRGSLLAGFLGSLFWGGTVLVVWLVFGPA